MGFIASLSRAARLYGSLVVVGPLLLFVAVEGWRALAYWCAVTGSATRPLPAAEEVTLSLVTVTVLEFVGYVWVACRSQTAARRHTLLAAGVNVIIGAVALYGLFVVLGRLLPNLRDFDPLDATSLTMAALLGAYLLSHRKTHR